MSSSAARLDRSAIELLLTCLEARMPILSAAALQRFPAEAAQLKAACLIEPRGHEASATALTDHCDSPVVLTWSPEHRAYGYFSETDGWIRVPGEDVESFSVDIVRFMAAIAGKLQISSGKAPVMIVDGHVWELGSGRLAHRTLRTPILFGRRLNDSGVWKAFKAALRNNPFAPPSPADKHEFKPVARKPSVWLHRDLDSANAHQRG